MPLCGRTFRQPGGVFLQLHRNRKQTFRSIFSKNAIFLQIGLAIGQDIVYNHPSAQVIICNSGIANACTGEEGFGYCRATAKAAAETLNVDENSVLVASTGVIGMQLPIEKLSAGVKAMAPKLQGTLEAGNDAAKAIMTTDTKEKEVTYNPDYYIMKLLATKIRPGARRIGALCISKKCIAFENMDGSIVLLISNLNSN